MLGQGLLLMFSGMGTVFVFLCVMIWIMMSVGVYFKKNEGRFSEDTDPKSASPKVAQESLEGLVAAIAVAMRYSK